MSLSHTLLPQLPLLAMIIGIAYFVRGMSGFGSGLIAVPLLSLQLPMSVALPAVALLDNVAALREGVQHRDAIAWRDLLPLTPMTLAGTASGLYLLQTAETELLKQVMAGILLIYALMMLWRPLNLVRRPLSVALPFGAAGGMISTLFGTGGPFYVIYLHLRGQTQRPLRATMASAFVLDGVIRLTGYLASGLLDGQLLTMVAMALPVMFGAQALGRTLHGRVSHAIMEKLIGLLLLGSGVAMWHA